MTAQGPSLFSQVTHPRPSTKSPAALGNLDSGPPSLQGPSLMPAVKAGAFTPENSLAETGWPEVWEDSTLLQKGLNNPLFVNLSRMLISPSVSSVPLRFMFFESVGRIRQR